MRIRFSDDKVVWLNTSSPANNAIAQVASGVGKAVEGFINFPTVAFQYITGTTTHFGEMESWSKIGQRFSGDYGDDPVNRAVNVFNHMVYGTLDLVLGHLPYKASVALGTQTYTPFFSPAPTTLEGLATDATNIGFLFALPAAGRAVKTAMGIPAKPVPVSETVLFQELMEAKERTEWQVMTAQAEARIAALQAERQQAAQNSSTFSAWMRGEQGLFGSQRGAVASFGGKLSGEALRARLLSELRRGNLEQWVRTAFDAGEFDPIELIRLSETSHPIRSAIRKHREHFAHAFRSEHITALLNSKNYVITDLLYAMAEYRSAFFVPEHIAQIIQLARIIDYQNFALSILGRLLDNQCRSFTKDLLISAMDQASKIQRDYTDKAITDASWSFLRSALRACPECFEERHKVAFICNGSDSFYQSYAGGMLRKNAPHLFGGERPTRSELPPLPDTPLARLITASLTDPEAVAAIKNLATHDTTSFTARHMQELIHVALSARNVFEVLDLLAKDQPQLLTEPVLSTLIHQLTVDHMSEAFASALETSIETKRPNFQRYHVTEVVALISDEMGKGRQQMVAAKTLYNLARYYPQLFLPDHLGQIAADIAKMERANTTPDNLMCMKDALNELRRHRALNPGAVLVDGVEGALDAIDGRQRMGQPPPRQFTTQASQMGVTPKAVEPVSIDAAELELRKMLAAKPAEPAAVQIPSAVHLTQLLGIAPERIPEILHGIARVSQAGLGILMRCQSDADFRNNLLTALHQMKAENTPSSWLADAVRQVESTANSKDSFLD